MNNGNPGLVRGSMMIAASLFTAGIFTLLTSVVIARSVSVAEFGFYSITVSLQVVVSLFSSFSIGTAVAKYVAEYNVRDFRHALTFARTGLWLVLFFSIVTAITYLALAKPIGYGLYHEPGVADLIPFSAMVTLTSAMWRLTSGVAQGNHRMKLISAMQVSTPAISLSAMIILLPHMGVRAPFIGLSLAQLAVALLAMYRLERTGFPLIGKVDRHTEVSHLRMLLSFAVPAVMAAVMVGPLYWFGNTVLALESGFLSVGHLAAAMVFFQAMALLASATVIPLVPRLSEMSVFSKQQVESLVSRSVRGVSVVFFPLFFIIALFSSDIVEFLYGPDYYNSSAPAYLLLTACYFYTIAALVGAAITGLARMWVGLGLNMIWAAIFVVLVLIMTPIYGPTGVAGAFAISYGIHLGSSIFVSNTILHLKIRKVLAPLASSIALFAAGFSPLMDVGGAPLFSKVLLLVLGTVLMLYFGRDDFVFIVKRSLGR